MITANDLADLPGIRHGFYTRRGGVSTGIYAGLNCGFGSGDDAGAVIRNRETIASNIGVSIASLLTVHQIHSPDVITVTTPWDRHHAPRADAMVTRQPGIALGILTADCAPVLFADAAAGVVGGAHAGWKGAFGGVLEATVAAMEALGALRANIRAVVGPTISSKNYEVGPEFKARFTAAAGKNEQFFKPSAKPDHFMFDLPAYVLSRLGAARIGAFGWTGDCTYESEEKFYSYRRTTHRGETDYGRLISAIVLEDEGKI